MVSSPVSDERQVIALVNEAELAWINGLSAPAHEAVEHWAFLLFLARGASHGKALEDWLQAEDALLRTLPAVQLRMGMGRPWASTAT